MSFVCVCVCFALLRCHLSAPLFDSPPRPLCLICRSLNFTRVDDVKVEGRRRWLGNAESDGKLMTFYGTGEGMSSGANAGGAITLTGSIAILVFSWQYIFLGGAVSEDWGIAPFAMGRVNSWQQKNYDHLRDRGLDPHAVDVSAPAGDGGSDRRIRARRGRSGRSSLRAQPGG